MTLGELSLSLQPGFASRPDAEGEGIPHLRPLNITEEGALSLVGTKLVSADSAQIKRYGLIEGDVLFNNTNSPDMVGKAALFKEKGTYVFSNHLTRIRVDASKVMPSFVHRYLFALWTHGFFKQQCNQWINQAAFNSVALAQLPIPVPSLTEQARIVEIVDEAEALRNLRQQIDLRTSDVEPALFNDIFGNSIANARGWPVLSVKDAVDLVNGYAFGPADWGQAGLPIIRIQNLKDPKSPFNYFGGHLEPRFLVSPGSILVSWAGQLVSFGVYFWNGPSAALNQHIFRVDPKIEFEKEYLKFVLGQVVEQATRSFQGSEMKHLTKNTLEEATILYPPMSLQKAFAAAVRELRKMELAQAGSALRLEHLFHSLLYHAFEGAI